jgi:hypothetical protein
MGYMTAYAKNIARRNDIPIKYTGNYGAMKESYQKVKAQVQAKVAATQTARQAGGGYTRNNY